jgi:hypothetical protein
MKGNKLVKPLQQFYLLTRQKGNSRSELGCMFLTIVLVMLYFSIESSVASSAYDRLAICVVRVFRHANVYQL